MLLIKNLREISFTVMLFKLVGEQCEQKNKNCCTLNAVKMMCYMTHLNDVY